MSQLVKARRAGIPAVAAVIGALIASPALADVTVSPPSALQGTGENLTFHVTNTGTQPVSSVTLKLADDTPVAEVYPLSVDDWAPKIDMKTLSTPLATIHGGAPATESASAITWLAMPGKALAPGRTADLSVAIGPMPDLSSMQFTLVSKYADGKPAPAMPPVTLKLTPASAAQAAAAAAEHSGHDGAATTVTQAPTGADAEDATFAQAVAEAQRGPSIWSITGWILAALLLIGGLVFILRGRHRAEEDDEPEEDEATPVATAEAAQPATKEPATKEPATKEPAAKEPVTAGSKWSFKG